MKKITLLIALVLFVPNIASAKRVKGLFGKSERIKRISDVDIKGPNGEDLYLAYKTTSQFFFMGVYMTDDGYVLGVSKNFGTYYPLDEEKIAAFQASGNLPDPLPDYGIPFTDRLWGFSLWILLAVFAGIWFFPKNKEAVFAQGCKYYFGKNVAVNYPKAKKYFEKSAKKNHAPSIFNLGIMHLNGQGVQKDIDKSIQQFKKSSELGYVDAFVTLGNLYYNGNEVKKDLQEALAWYTGACNRGHESACKMVTHLQANGTE
ncbi:tetratricopeptide repeat protein [Flagellimonas allohymeniacidonis]|uniref:Sel1 repeat family protein n=1 Tax=Flagellimonas allohymeniacidonis TaxID=2517819 RepID=A0A4V2HSD5_9FLAO|nr:tetratricopeptide repeat protein [Allomuricauda hymeniacidonis]TAI47340.1 sel1 repeat family protein [Allomuricauda hymeniacidonis]